MAYVAAMTLQPMGSSVLRVGWCAVLAVLAGGWGLGADANDPGASGAFPVSIQVDAARSQGELRSIWRFFGADEPNYATMKNGRRLVGELGALRPQAVYFRAHNLLCTGDGTPALKWGSSNAYTEDAQGRPAYDWTIVDGIFDAYRAAGVRPYVEIGFMPRALSVKPEPYQHHWTPAAKYEEIYTAAFVTEHVASADDALAGARDIVAETIADTAEVRAFRRVFAIRRKDRDEYPCRPSAHSGRERDRRKKGLSRE